MPGVTDSITASASAPFGDHEYGAEVSAVLWLATLATGMADAMIKARHCM